MLIDTHCHLDAPEFAPDREAVYLAARAAGVGGLIVPAVRAADFPVVLDLCTRLAGCIPALGIHPLYIHEATEQDLDVLRQALITHPQALIGEIGLDYFVPAHDAPRQQGFFDAQLKLARELDRPVLLHSRRAVDVVTASLRRNGIRRGIAHAFAGSRQQAEALLKQGLKLGFGGAMTYRGSTRIRALAASLPDEAIVLETDAPDIPPAWLNRGRNSPAELPRIARELAELRGVSETAIATMTVRNTLDCLGLPGDWN